jgi:hypothetical protein
MNYRWGDYDRTDAKSKYKWVYELKNKRTGDVVYLARMYSGHLEGKKMFDTERDAALAVDRFLIGKGKEPVNILKRR